MVTQDYYNRTRVRKGMIFFGDADKFWVGDADEFQLGDADEF